MKTVFVLGSTDLGGAEKQAILIGKKLSELGDHESLIYFLSGNQGIAIDLCRRLSLAFKIGNLDSFPLPVRMIKFYKDLRDIKPDILLPYTIIPNKYCALFWRSSGAKACIWNQRDEGLGMKNSFFYQFCLSRVSAIICNSENSKNYLLRNFEVKRKLYVINNAIPGGINISQIEKENKEFIILMVANITRFKDHETLIKAFNLFLQKYQGKLLLAGRFGDNYKNVYELAKDLRIHENIGFLGYIENMDAIFRQADIFVLSSKSEGMPNAVLEAMNYSLCILGSNIEGISAIVSEENKKFLSDIGDYKKLGENLEFLYKNPKLRSEIGQKNKELVNNKYSLDVAVSRLTHIISNL